MGTYGKQERCAGMGHLRETGEVCGVWGTYGKQERCAGYGALTGDKRDVRGKGHLRKTGEMRAGLSCVDLREGDQLEDLGVDGIRILKRIPEKRNGETLS